MPDAAPLPCRFRQFFGHQVCGAARVPALAQVIGDDGCPANVEQERPAEVELALAGRTGRERLPGADAGVLT